MMRTSANVEALLEVENRAPDVLFETLPGTDIPVWPFLRQSLAQAAANAELGTIPAEAPSYTAPFLVQAVRNLIPGPLSSRRIARHRDILFIASGSTLQFTPTVRRNWLTDHFAGVFPDDSVVVQDRPIDTGRNMPLPAFPHTFSYSDTITRTNIVSELAPLPGRTRNIARDIVRALIAEFPFELSAPALARLERFTLFKLARTRHEGMPFERLLDRVQPAIAFVDGASYGGRARLTQLLKARGTVVAELQHGWIGPYHTAYNFGAAMSSPQLFRALPDFVLTFGDFWSEIIRHPARLVAIGKPHLEAESMQAKQRGVKADEVLVVSSVFQREELTEHTLTLRRLLPKNWTVRFRPHPSERGNLESLYPGLVGHSGIEFDNNSDVATSLTTARAVFGFSSTVLYEALAFNCQVTVIDSPLADYSSDVATFGERVRDVSYMERALEPLLSGRGASKHPDLDRIWKPGALANFRNFIDSIRASGGYSPDSMSH